MTNADDPGTTSSTGAHGAERSFERVPVAPSLQPALDAARMPFVRAPIDARVVVISALAIGLGFAAAVVARILTTLIALITHLAFYGRVSLQAVSPAGNRLGLLVVVVPVVGGLVVGLMARYGSAAIRGHGIPEAMEQVLFNESRIPPRMTFLKPISAAIAIGTGGPFGAEGPIIATGGALGSLVGQVVRVSAEERKTLLAAGAAAGMSATFGSPVSAVLLAVELLLFEYRGRSLVPVALASAAACGARLAFFGAEAAAPAFSMPAVGTPTGLALASYVAVGAVAGLFAMLITRAVYAVEDAFEHLPVHWMWWPAFGGLAVGLVGIFAPHAMGVGYDNIDRILSGGLAGRAVVIFCGLKFIAWVLSLGTGTSGGTLAPLFTIGGGIGAATGTLLASLLPGAAIDPRVAALVGMAALFAGASRALLASVVFAFETTRQPMSLLPLLGGCTAAYLVSALTMRHSIMTEKIARRGARVVSDYAADLLEQMLVGDVASRPAIVLRTTQSVADVRAWMTERAEGSAHQGFPVLDDAERIAGVVSRRDVFEAPASEVMIGDLLKRAPAVVYEDSSLREAADHMVREAIGRLPVVTRADPEHIVAILTRTDLIAAHGRRLDAERRNEPSFRIPVVGRRRSRRPPLPRDAPSNG